MANTLTGATIRFSLTGTNSVPVGAGTKSIAFDAVSGTYSNTLDTGTSSGQANALVTITGTLTAGTPVDLDLTALSNAGLATTTTLTDVKSIVVQEYTDPIGTNYLLVGDSSGTLTNAITAFGTVATWQQRVGSGGAWAVHNELGYTVDSSHKVLRLNATAGTAKYRISLFGSV